MTNFIGCPVFIGPWCTWGQIYGSGSLKLSETPFADLTDVLVLVVKFATNASAAI